MTYRNTVLIVLLIFSQSCNVKSDKKDLNNTDQQYFTAPNDTSSLWEQHVLDIDSLDINVYKRFVRERTDYFTDENYSFQEIDSTYNNILSDVEMFLRIQDLATIEFKENSSHRSNYLIQITNDSKYLIDALIISFEYFDIYKSYIGREEREIIADIPPGETYTQNFTPLYRGNRVIYNDYSAFYGGTAISKISIPENESVEARILGTVYKTGIDRVPDFLEIGNGRNIHMFRSDL